MQTIEEVMFENDVKMYGTETEHRESNAQEQFENDVKMYGTETKIQQTALCSCLRMM